MLSKRYSIVVADRSSGVVRRFTIALGPFVAAVFFVLAIPILMGLGARQSAIQEIDKLSAQNVGLAVENTSYRRMTQTLTTQIASLQTAITDLSSRSNIDPNTIKALKKIPALAKASATGGGGAFPPHPKIATTTLSPSGTFGVLQDLLHLLEQKLQIVRTDVERRAAVAAATPSIWPVNGWISAGFGRRDDPFTGAPDFHAALDISADSGQPISATAAGTIDHAGPSGPYGKLVIINHGYNITTRYGHLSKIAVHVGQKVSRGDTIGYVGSTGRSTGPHLHYEVWNGDKPLNPLQILGSPYAR